MRTQTYNTTEITHLSINGEDLIVDGVELDLDWTTAKLISPTAESGGMVVSVRFNREEAKRLFEKVGDEKVSTYIKRVVLG